MWILTMFAMPEDLAVNRMDSSFKSMSIDSVVREDSHSPPGRALGCSESSGTSEAQRVPHAATPWTKSADAV